MNSPCFNCEKRNPNCHSNCKEYLEYSNALKAINKERAAYNACRSAYTEMNERRFIEWVRSKSK